MILPIFHRIGNGVFITDEAVYWVELSRSLLHTRIRRYEKVPVEQGAVEHALQGLAKKINHDAPYVATHLDAAHVRHFILDAPVFEEEESLQHYLTAQVANELPVVTRGAEFMIRHCVLQASEDRLRCLVVCARREAVEERIRLFGAAGLSPVVIGTLVGDLGHAFSFESTFAEGRSAVFYMDQSEGVLLLYEDGTLADCRDVWAEDPSVAVVEVGLQMAAREAAAPDHAPAGPLRVTGPAASSFLMTSLEEPLCPMEEGVPLLSLARKDRLPAAYAAAAGLAVRQLYPALTAVNLVDEAAVAHHRQEAEKKEAYRTLMAVGGSVFVLFALIAAMHLYVGKQLEQASGALMQAGTQIASVDRAQAELDQVQAEQREARALMEARTHTATLMEAVGKAVPENVWLDRMQLRNEAGRSEVSIQGSAYDEQETARFLASLEGMSRLRNVRLMYSEVASLRVSTHPAVPGQPSHHRFEIRAEVLR